MRFAVRFVEWRWLLAVLPCLFLCGCGLVGPWNAGRAGNDALITQLKCDQSQKGRLRLVVKDNIDVRGVVTTAGSKYLATTRKPAEKDAPCLAIARERNVDIIGKANLSEFAVSPSGMNEYYGTPRNPYCFWRRRIPGGSSSGSAVAVAGGLADVGFGTDTAGSIRVPAACCGIVGLKTTHGLVSIDGVFPIEPKHMDTVGPMGRDVASTVVGMDLLQRGFLGQYTAAKAAQPTGASIRVGRLRAPGADPKVEAAVDKALEKAGFQVVPLAEEFTKKWEQAKEDGTAVAASGAWISDKQYQYASGVSLRTKVVILAGRVNYTTKYQAAVGRREKWQAALREVFQKVDFIVMPTLQHAPPNKTLDFGLLEAEMLKLQNTVPANYAGVPALAMPIPGGNTGFIVTSIQLMGPMRSEAKLLNAGRILEAKCYPSHRGSFDRLATGCEQSAYTEEILRGH